jgi:aminoglycoside 3-N-acetyltransferase
MTGYRDFISALRRLEIARTSPVIAHVSLSAFGEVQGGAETLLGALMAAYQTLVMPTFTFKTMLTPEVGPPENAIEYGSGKDLNLMAEFFREEMPADRLMGAVAEALRKHPRACRSAHPILSFAGINTDHALEEQTLDEPFAPLGELLKEHGWVLLLGVDHTANTSIHYAEKLAGRKQFVRWALTPKGVVECPGFPGCSNGFQAVSPYLKSAERTAVVAGTQILAVSLVELVETVRMLIAGDPEALLCSRADCERCNAVRAAIREKDSH